MRITNEDLALFYKLNWALLYYINRKYPIIKSLNSPNLKGQKIEDVAKLNDKLFSHPELIDSFIKENPFYFNGDEVKIIKSWKNFIKGKFFVFSIENKNIFLDGIKEPKAYEVYGLSEEIKDILPFEPYMVDAILLPFKGKITYSGVFNGYSVSFGSGMKKTVYEDFLKAKRKFGIISSLEEPVTEKNESYEELLRFYLKNENIKFEYEENINEILQKNPELTKVYYQELSKKNARKIRKKLSEIRVKEAYFAIFDNLIIASADNEREVLEKAKNLLPEDKQEGVFVFKYKLKTQEKEKH